MGETYEAEVTEVVYAGPHPVLPGIYEIEVKVAPPPGTPSAYVTLRFRPAEAAFLTQLLQANPPQVPAHDNLLDQVAGHDT